MLPGEVKTLRSLVANQKVAFKLATLPIGYLEFTLSKQFKFMNQ